MTSLLRNLHTSGRYAGSSSRPRGKRHHPVYRNVRLQYTGDQRDEQYTRKVDIYRVSICTLDVLAGRSSYDNARFHDSKSISGLSQAGHVQDTRRQRVVIYHQLRCSSTRRPSELQGCLVNLEARVAASVGLQSTVCDSKTSCSEKTPRACQEDPDERLLHVYRQNNPLFRK